MIPVNSRKIIAALTRQFYVMLLPFSLCFLSACASLDQGLYNDVNTLKADVSDLREEARIQRELNKTQQQRMANLDLKIDDEVRSDIQQVKGQLEENQNQVKRSLKGMEDRLARMEGGRVSSTTMAPEGPPGSSPNGAATPSSSYPYPSQKPTTVDPEEVYAAAYDLYKEGHLDEAREAFRKFINQFPQTEYSDNAQFWIAECFFRANKFEQAILAYEEVVKKYPKGNKVPDALLKQGICFGSLGDRDSSRILLQRVIESYPDSPQAEIARKELQKLS